MPSVCLKDMEESTVTFLQCPVCESTDVVCEYYEDGEDEAHWHECKVCKYQTTYTPIEESEEGQW